MTETERTAAPPQESAPVIFEGFPYLITRVVPAMHHVILLPRNWTPDLLGDFARRQVQANRLPGCLVLAADFCVYFKEDGAAFRSVEPPSGAEIVSGKLAPAEPLLDSTDLAVRRMELILHEEAQHRGPGTSIILGDVTKGGRPAAPEEQEQLAGTHMGGVPKGLLPCPECGDWRGECFDTLIPYLIVRVHCRCENDNRCAACGALLYGRKLNANYYEPADDSIWHVPGFSGFHHIFKQHWEGD